MDKRILQLPCAIVGYARKKDRSITIRLQSTIEVETQVIADVDTFMMQEGWMVFSENEIQDKDIPKELAPSDGKSQSQRLRDVLYVYYHQLKDKGDTTESFNVFYDRKLEKIISHFKEKLPEML